MSKEMNDTDTTSKPTRGEVLAMWTFGILIFTTIMGIRDSCDCSQREMKAIESDPALRQHYELRYQLGGGL